MKTRIAGVVAEWGNFWCGARLLCAGVLLASSGCALSAAAARDGDGTRDSGSAVRLNVTNNYNSPMEIYAAGQGTVYRMGTVLPGLVGHFVVRPGMIGNGPVEFFAQSNNREAPVRSDRLLLSPGNVVDFEIAFHPIHSTATIRP